LILGTFFAGEKTTQKRAKVPAYVWLFILMGALNATGIVPIRFQEVAKTLSDVFILMAMTAMGLGVNFRDIKGKGGKAVVFGLVLFGITSSIAFVMIAKGWVI
jgi:uncharacterized membrane protein YadS